jgi:TolB-like protein/DNA-binding winged helix-turn-helix (wHTH) protein
MAQPIRFGSAEVRPGQRLLLLDGRPVVIGARAFDVLSLLIAHRERVVCKEELLDSVWPGLFVEENNLQVQISALRKILGAGAISTVIGRGYQFTASVDADSPPATAAPDAATDASSDRAASTSSLGALHSGARLVVAIGIIAGVGLGLWAYSRVRPNATDVPAPIVNASLHSVAVLPFANMSGDPAQDYFAEGLSEEILDSLSSIPDLHVAARTSSFTFKGKGARISDIGRHLNVGTVLEGSVRKDGQHVRINAHLVDAATGYDLWSHSYDRDITNILALQAEIAAAVTTALKARLLPNASAVIELGGTRNPRAFDAYLRGETLAGSIDRDVVLARIAAYDEAIRQDPDFAKAHVGRAVALELYGGAVAPSDQAHEFYVRARAAAEKAIALAPELGRAHAALGQILMFGFFDFTRALAENERALALSAGDAFVLRRSVRVLAFAGRTESAVTNALRAVALDPINASSHASLGDARYSAHQYRESIEAYDRALRINPSLAEAHGFRGLSYRKLGQLNTASLSCSTPPMNISNRVCLAIVYRQQARTAEAEAELANLRQTIGDAWAFQYAEIYAQWGDVPTALQWLDTAYRLHDPGLATLRTDELLDPLRTEPRFQEVERMLGFPN